MSVKTEGFTEAKAEIAALIGASAAARKKAVLAGGNVVKRVYRRTLPKPGYPGDKPELKPLRETVAVKVIEYAASSTSLAVVGARYPAGAHAHLVEEGHKQVLWGQETSARVPGKHYMLKAVNLSREEANRKMIDKLKAEVAKETRVE